MPEWLTELSRLAGEAQRAWAIVAPDGGLPEAQRAEYALRCACTPERILALAGVVAAAEEHGACTCEHYGPGFPRGHRHATACDDDPALRAALTALEATP